MLKVCLDCEEDMHAFRLTSIDPDRQPAIAADVNAASTGMFLKQILNESQH